MLYIQYSIYYTTIFICNHVHCAVESYVNKISFSDNVNFCVDICGGCNYFGTHPCGPFPFDKLFIIYSPLSDLIFSPLFLFRILPFLPLRFLFYIIFNTSACRFPLFCWLRKIRSALCIHF